MYLSICPSTGPKQIYTRTTLFWFGPNSFGLDYEFSTYFKLLAFVLKDLMRYTFFFEPVKKDGE